MGTNGIGEESWEARPGGPGGRMGELGTSEISSGDKVGVWPGEWVAEVDWQRNHWQ